MYSFKNVYIYIYILWSNISVHLYILYSTIQIDVNNPGGSMLILGHPMPMLFVYYHGYCWKHLKTTEQSGKQIGDGWSTYITLILDR